MTQAAVATDSTSNATIASSQPRLRGSVPLAKARRRVRTISRSLSASTNWLKAPALADATQHRQRQHQCLQRGWPCRRARPPGPPAR